MTAGVRATIVMVHRAVYHTDGDISVMKTREQNLTVCSSKSEAKVKK